MNLVDLEKMNLHNDIDTRNLKIVEVDCESTNTSYKVAGFFYGWSAQLQTTDAYILIKLSNHSIGYYIPLKDVKNIAILNSKSCKH